MTTTTCPVCEHVAGAATCRRGNCTCPCVVTIASGWSYFDDGDATRRIAAAIRSRSNR